MIAEKVCGAHTKCSNGMRDCISYQIYCIVYVDSAAAALKSVRVGMFAVMVALRDSDQ